MRPDLGDSLLQVSDHIVWTIRSNHAILDHSNLIGFSNYVTRQVIQVTKGGKLYLPVENRWEM